MIEISKIVKKIPDPKRETYEERDVESGHEGNDVQGETNVTANDTELSLKWQLIQGVPLDHPAAAETDMGKADAAPDEKV